MKRGLGGSLAVIALALAFVSSASAADPSFSAHGSVEQVYATGLPAGAEVSLLDPSGQVVATRNANDLGGLLFRNVSPGDGYRVRLAASGETSEPLTVLTTQSAPPSHRRLQPDDPVRRLRLPDDARRHQARLLGPSAVRTSRTREGIDLPTNPLGDSIPSPTLIEYSGYGYADPAGPAERDRGARQPDGLHGRRRQHARHRLLGRGVRLLRAAAEPRRLRHRSRPSPASRGSRTTRSGCWASPTAASASSSPPQTQPPSLAAIAPLSVIDQTQTTLYPGGILNTGFAVAWAQERAARGAAGRPRQRPALGVRADPGGRSDLRGQPGPAPRGGGPDRQDPRERPLHARGRRPARRRSRSSTRSTCRSSWPASGPTSRRAATARRSPST